MGGPGEPICMLPGMLELVDLLLSESIQLSGEKLFMHASMCESKAAATRYVVIELISQ